MKHKKRQTGKEISDKVAADALRGAGGFGPAPTHAAMDTKTTASPTDDDGDNDNDAGYDDGDGDNDYDEDRT